MDNKVRQFLGRGWKFPVKVDRNTGRILMSEHEEDIQEAVRIIILTRKGERAMQPDFGSDAYKLVFGSKEVTDHNILSADIRDALIQWEPRIKDVEVSIEDDPLNPEKLFINVNYVVRSTNNPFNMVYPFYINEGMG